MDASRAQKIAQVLKETKTLGKEIGKPVGGPAAAAASRAAIDATSRFPTGTLGTTIMKYVMYFIATLLAIGLVVLAIDQWITPVFKRLPANLPGIDKTQDFWPTSSAVQAIIIGTPPPASGSTSSTTPYCSVLEGQPQYGITIDVKIDDEFPQSIIPGTGNTSNERIFFIIGSLESPKLQISLDNSINTVYVKSYSGDNRSNPKAALIENVPVHTPFRIGVVVYTTYVETYLNGKLYSTVQFGSDHPSFQLANQDKVLPPSAITMNSIAYGAGIQVLNFRAFGYVPSAEELLSRMSDLTKVESYA